MPPVSSPRSCLVLILAAGEGTRMRTPRAKVLHEIAGLSLLGHVVSCVKRAEIPDIAVVISPSRPEVGEEAQRLVPSVKIFFQEKQWGTAHAVLAAQDLIRSGFDDLIVLFGDTPLIQPETLRAIRADLAKGIGVTIVGFEAFDPTGYGRLICEGDHITHIREEKDASAEERKIRHCNAGLMGLRGDVALELLQSITSENKGGEYYLTDVVALARKRGLATSLVLVAEADVRGVNTQAQLAQAEAQMQDRLRQQAMAQGVRLVAPETIFLSFDTQIAPDVCIHPHVVMGLNVTIETGAIIHSFSHLEGARIGAQARIGPFARLRPGTDLAKNVKVGNFVELKAARIGEGAAISHLSYIGDAQVGEKVNIGAGTITCNYDGKLKYTTCIGAYAFIGSNTTLVAPVSVGQNSYIGAGSVITQDVEARTLALGRARQVNKPDWIKKTSV